MATRIWCDGLQNARLPLSSRPAETLLLSSVQSTTQFSGAGINREFNSLDNKRGVQGAISTDYGKSLSSAM